jgi:hypothetical protein
MIAIYNRVKVNIGDVLSLGYRVEIAMPKTVRRHSRCILTRTCIESDESGVISLLHLVSGCATSHFTFPKSLPVVCNQGIDYESEH